MGCPLTWLSITILSLHPCRQLRQLNQLFPRFNSFWCVFTQLLLQTWTKRSTTDSASASCSLVVMSSSFTRSRIFIPSASIPAPVFVLPQSVHASLILRKLYGQRQWRQAVPEGAPRLGRPEAPTVAVGYLKTAPASLTRILL